MAYVLGLVNNMGHKCIDIKTLTRDLTVAFIGTCRGRAGWGWARSRR